MYSKDVNKMQTESQLLINSHSALVSAFQCVNSGGTTQTLRILILIYPKLQRYVGTLLKLHKIKIV